jgi:hypothetical protein
MAEKTKEPGGGRLNRSQTVTVRLDPRLNYLCELGARVQRRTKSSFIEWAIDRAIDQVVLVPGSPFGEEAKIGEMADTLWHVREHERLIALATHGPHLMTMEEQEIWAVICEHGHFWRGRWKDNEHVATWTWEARPDKLIHERVAESWEQILQVATEEAEAAEVLPKYLKHKHKGTPDDLDAEIPF